MKIKELISLLESFRLGNLDSDIYINIMDRHRFLIGKDGGYLGNINWIAPIETVGWNQDVYIVGYLSETNANDSSSVFNSYYPNLFYPHS